MARCDRWGIVRVVLGVVLGSGLLAADIRAASVVHSTFLVTPWATVEGTPTALAFGPGGPLGESLYVVEQTPGGETSRLLALNPAAQAAVFAEGFQRPTSLIVGTGGVWGTLPYLLEGMGDRSFGLRVVQVGPEGTRGSFPVPPGGARAPGGLALSSGGPWDVALYLSDAAEGQLLQLSPTGDVQVIRTGLSGPRALALAPPGSPFGDGLFVATGRAVVQVGRQGEPRVLVEALLAPSALAFGPGGLLGEDLYLIEGGLSDGRLLRISLVGGVTLIAEGLGPLSGLALAAGPPFGPAVYVADTAARLLYRLTPTGP